MRQITLALGVLGVSAVAALGGAVAIQDNAEQPTMALEQSGTRDTAPALKKAKSSDATVAAPTDASAPDTRPETPMADRVAVLGLLNKRNGDSRDITLKPGQGVRVGDVVVRLRACETTADWEPEQLTGAFVQLDTRDRQGQWKRVFSGWLYKESPSLNVVEDPVYDVWPKSCAMTHPDVGPDTELVSAVARGGAARSTAKKSPDADDADDAKAPGGAADVPDSASSNSAR